MSRQDKTGQLTLVSCKSGFRNNTPVFKIELSNGSQFQVKNFYLNYFYGIHETGGPEDSGIDELEMKEGRKITSGEEDAFRFASMCYKAERTGSRLISRAEQTSSGLARKLESRGYDQSSVSAVLQWFEKYDLVNDSRYAERWLRARISRKTGKIPGPRKLSAALGSRGIRGSALKEAFDRTLDEETEYSLLLRFMSKNHNGGFSGSYSLRARLRYEGFSSSVINRYLEELT